MNWKVEDETPAQVWRRAKDAFARREACGGRDGAEPDEASVSRLLWSALAWWRARRMRAKQ